jgi:hypothetical protein
LLFAFVNQIGKAEMSAQQNYGGNFGITEAGRESRVEDGIAPSSKGPFTITDKFGATSITTTGDGLAVSPNIQQTPLIKSPQQTVVQQSPPTIDYDKMAQALSKVQVQTNIDGVQVSNQIFNKPSAGIAMRKI